MAILKEKVSLSNEDIRKLRSLRPGMPLDLQVSTPTSAKRVKTEFVGMDGVKTLIFRFPDENKWGNLRDAIYPEHHLIVRFILEEEAGEIIAFKSKILFVMTKPSHLVFVSFPKAIQNHGLRSDKRAQIRLPSKITNSQGMALTEGVMLDLSSGGCRFSALRKAPGAKLEEKNILITVTSPTQQEFKFSGVVMNQKVDDVNFFYGVKFDTSVEEEEVGKLLEQLVIV